MATKPTKRPQSAKKSAQATRIPSRTKARSVRKTQAAPVKQKIIDPGWAWDDRLPLAQAKQIGNTIYVSGTVGRNEDGTDGPPDAYVQAKNAIRTIEKALEHAGASLKHAVRTRVFLTDITHFDDAARAHGEAFGEIRPASSMLAVSALADPWMLVEIEAVAVI